jgi:hypothetical protein
MAHPITKILLLVAVGYSLLPADCCLLILSVQCCHESPSIQSADLDDDDDHAEHRHAPREHHSTCAVTPAQGLVAVAQPLPALNLHLESMDKILNAALLGAPQIGGKLNCCDGRGRPQACEAPVYLRLQVFLV